MNYDQQYQEQQDQITAGRLLSPVTQWYLFNPNNFRPFTNGGTIRLPFSGIARPGSIGGWLGKKIPWVRGFLDGSGHSTAREYATASMWWSPFGKQYKTTSGAEPFGGKIPKPYVTKPNSVDITLSAVRPLRREQLRLAGPARLLQIGYTPSLGVRGEGFIMGGPYVPNWTHGTDWPSGKPSVVTSYDLGVGRPVRLPKGPAFTGRLLNAPRPKPPRSLIVRPTGALIPYEKYELRNGVGLNYTGNARVAEYESIGPASPNRRYTVGPGKANIRSDAERFAARWERRGASVWRGTVGFGKGVAKVGWRGAVLGARVTSYALWGMLAWDIAKSIGQPLGRDLVTQAERANEKLRSINAWEFGGNLTAAYLSNGAATERQRAIQAISQSRFNGRAAMGSEAMYGHQGY